MSLSSLEDPNAGYRWEVGDYPHGVGLYLRRHATAENPDSPDLEAYVILTPERARELADTLIRASRRAEKKMEDVCA